MISTSPSHFSYKVLIFSLIFLMATMGVHVLRTFTSTEPTPSLSPVLTFTGNQVTIKSSYESRLSQATSGQWVRSDTDIQTGPGQEAELTLGGNHLKLQENTQVRVVENTISDPQSPRLVVGLIQGGVGVNAFDEIVVQAPHAELNFHQAAGLVTHGQEGLNRVMVISGDVSLSLFTTPDQPVADFIVPWNNQVTFSDTQITEVYAELKPSKLKKELKITGLSQEIFQNTWVQNNIIQKQEEQQKKADDLIHSSLFYHLKDKGGMILSWFSFRTDAQAYLAQEQIQTKLHYILGKLSDTQDRAKAKDLLSEVEVLVRENSTNPRLIYALRETLFDSEQADYATVNYMVKDFLVDQLQAVDGPFLFRAYLNDLRKILSQGQIQTAEQVLKKWQERWTEAQITQNFEEYKRQSQILNSTLLSSIQAISIPLLDAFDATGENRIKNDKDVEEARFEVAQERLQLTASLITAQRYVLAKQYLKNSYLTLKIEQNDQKLPSTQIFLETGRLLAQRLDYAEKVLKNAPQSIDETKFLEYVQSKARDQALTQDLKDFFQLEQVQQEQTSTTPLPSLQEVVQRFDAAGAQVSVTDVDLINPQTLLFQVKQVTLKELDVNGQTPYFEATYDFPNGSVVNVKLGEKLYKGPFILTDLIALLKAGELNALPASASAEVGDVSQLISDQAQTEALQGQAMAQDLAIKLALSKLTEAGLVIPDIKTNIQVLDPVNLDKFKVTHATLSGMSAKEWITFNYFSTLGKATDLRSSTGTLLLKESPLSELASQSLLRLADLEKQTKAIEDFKIYMAQNELTIDASALVYTGEDRLQLTDLTLSTLGLKATGLYEVTSGKFLSVKNGTLTLQNVALKDFFEQAADADLIEKFKAEGITVLPYQIEAAYPFRTIRLKNVVIGGTKFEFSLNYQDFRPFNIRNLDSNQSVENMSFEALKTYANPS